MANGKHKTQIDRFKQRMKALGAVKPDVHFTRTNIKITFGLIGDHRMIDLPVKESEVQTAEQLHFLLDNIVGHAITLKFGAVWMVKKAP